MGYIKQKFRSVKKLPDWIYFFPALLLKTLFKCFYRFEIDDKNGYIRDLIKGHVGVCWHNRLMFFAAAFPADMRKNTMAVVSASRDGQYIVDLIRQFGLGSLRGSSSKKGANAQLAAVRAIRDNYNVVFTPDGPRGPRYKMKNGPIHLASYTGKMVVPISINASSYWEVKSWDRFQIPKPFAKLTLVMGKGFYIPEKLTAEELEKYRRQVEENLLSITVDREK